MADTKLTYKDAGVDTKEGERAVSLMKEHVKGTFNKNVLTGLGSFGSLFALDVKDMKEPVLVSGTDGVGTKLKLAFLMDKHGCKQSGSALVGGETAEMPGFYGEGEYDMAGFSVGIVDKDKIITGDKVKPGNKIIGIASSGIHSNGYSLVRKVFFDKAGMKVDDYVEELGETLGEALLRPTRIYADACNAVLPNFEVNGIVHITGGGFYENIPRILPEGTAVVIDVDSWEKPPIFDFISKTGDIEKREMFSTFNMGIGMMMVVDSGEAQAALEALRNAGEKAWIIGDIAEDKGEKVVLNL